MIPPYLQNLADELKRRKESKFKYNITELLRMEMINTELRGYLNKAEDVLKKLKAHLINVKRIRIDKAGLQIIQYPISNMIAQLEEEIKFIQGVLK